MILTGKLHRTGFKNIARQSADTFYELKLEAKIDIIDSLSINELNQLSKEQRKALIDSPFHLPIKKVASLEKKIFLLPDLSPEQIKRIPMDERLQWVSKMTDENKARLAEIKMEALSYSNYWN